MVDSAPGSPEGELVGSDPERVAGELEAALAEREPSLTWTTERDVGRSPLDVAGDRIAERL